LNAASHLPERVAWIFGDTEIVTDEGTSGTVFRQNGLVITHSPSLFNHPLSELVWDPKRARVCELQSSLIRRAALIELKCFSEGYSHAEDFLAGLQVASRFAFAAVPAVVTRLYRTSDLRQSSLESTLGSSGDRYNATTAGYAVAAQAAGPKPWGALHAGSVRALCKWRAQQDLPIRRLALEQFRFGISTRSIIFFGAALLGGAFFRAGFAAKRKLRLISQAK
jgi:hypothetical protein